jgi:ribosome-associated protein
MSDFDDIYPEDEEEFVRSKTEIKREMAELQELGTKIVELSEKYISRIPLEGQLAEAIHQARGMKHREGRRRQLQFIGKLMRKAENIDDIRAAYQKIVNIGQEHTKIQHQCEQWRDKLMDDGNSALQGFINDFPAADVQHLRQLIRNAQKERSQQKPPSSARKLFKYIRELIEA